MNKRHFNLKIFTKNKINMNNINHNYKTNQEMKLDLKWWEFLKNKCNTVLEAILYQKEKFNHKKDFLPFLLEIVLIIFY